MPALIIDIETCPVDIEHAKSLPDEEQTGLLNPIDSRIVAIGIRYNESIILQDEEKRMLEAFWLKWRAFRKTGAPVVGFNILSFDLPFLVARSFINNVAIAPFTLKEIIDLREKLSAYRYGKTRGKLKEYAELIGLKTLDIDGSDIMQLCIDNDQEKIGEYLRKDLEITEALYNRAEALNITKISRW
ncbi:MAG: ribonuclease H-like domain-containing protein [archaeon]